MFNKDSFLGRKGDANKSPSSSQLLKCGKSDGGVENEGSASAEGFLCPLCFSAFPTAEQQKNHYESAHPESSTGGIGQSGSFICPACKMKFASENECDSHYKRHHLMTDDVNNELQILRAEVQALTEREILLQKELQMSHSQSLVKVLKEEYVSVEKLMNEKTVKLEDVKDELLQQVEKLQKICSDFDNQFKGISSGCSEMQNNISLKNIELTAMQEKYLTSEEVNKKLQQNVSALQEMVRSSKDRIETLEKSEIELKIKVEELQEDGDKLFAGESSALKDAIAQCGGYKNTNDKLNSQLQALMEDQQKMLQLKEETFTTERKMYEGEIKNLESCMQVAKKFFETQFGDSLDVQIQSEGTDTSVNKDKTSELGLAFKALSLKMESDRMELSRNKEKIEGLTKKFTEASEESNSLRLKNKDLQQRCGELSKDMKYKEKSYAELEKNLESVEVTNEELRTSLENLTKELADVKENGQQLLEDTQEELAKCQKRLKEVDEQLDISLKVATVPQYKGKKKRREKDLNGQISRLSGRIQKLERQHTQDETELKNAHTQINEMGHQHVLEEQKLKSEHKLNEFQMNKKYIELKTVFQNSEKCRATSVESLANTQKVLQEKILQSQKNEEEFRNAKKILVAQKLDQLQASQAMKLDFENRSAELMRRIQAFENIYCDFSQIDQFTAEQVVDIDVFQKGIKENAIRAFSKYEAQISIRDMTIRQLNNKLLELEANCEKETSTLVDQCLKFEDANEKLLMTNAELQRRLENTLSMKLICDNCHRKLTK